MEFLVGPLIVFLIFVAPLWVIMHYRSRNKSQSSISTEDKQVIEGLLERFDKMSDRIETLESILDKEHGNWRSQDK